MTTSRLDDARALRRLTVIARRDAVARRAMRRDRMLQLLRRAC
ncbi:hypothetical protein [Nocardioides sp.]|nr:hypothetical protein [Nocardioides sp.]